MWDPGTYLRFGSERARPFFDLLSRVGADAPGFVADLGCGPGNLTAALAARWPGARVLGVDSSPEMIEAARAELGGAEAEAAEGVAAQAAGLGTAAAPAGRLEFRLADIRRQFNRIVQQARGLCEILAIKNIIYSRGYEALPKYADDMLVELFSAGNVTIKSSLVGSLFLYLARRRVTSWSNRTDNELRSVPL